MKSDQYSNELDKETREILKKSLQKLPDHDFDKKVMQKIHTEAAKESKLAKTKLLAWIMIIISALLIPLTIWVISGKFYTIQTKVFSFTFEEPGNYDYQIVTHPWTPGGIVVVE